MMDFQLLSCGDLLFFLILGDSNLNNNSFLEQSKTQPSLKETVIALFPYLD